jgi:hypothetical protein
VASCALRVLSGCGGAGRGADAHAAVIKTTRAETNVISALASSLEPITS